MSRPRLVDQRVVEHAKGLATRAQTIEDLRCAQAVLLPALLNATLEQTAAALGMGRASVGRYQAKVRRRLTHPAQLDAQWGGRRRAAMSLQFRLLHCAFLVLVCTCLIDFSRTRVLPRETSREGL